MNERAKITANHLSRQAIVYLRQSSAAQVENNREFDRSTICARRQGPGARPASFIAHPPDLQFWPLMDMDFATSCPLVRPALPHIR